MTDGIVIAVIGGLGAVIVALLGYLVTQLVKLGNRVRALEVRDRRSWLYIRSLIDYAYRHTDTTQYPLPEPPEGWLDDIKE